MWLVASLGNRSDRQDYIEAVNYHITHNSKINSLEYFKKIIEYERTPCDDIRQRLKDINILVEQIKVKSHLFFLKISAAISISFNFVIPVDIKVCTL